MIKKAEYPHKTANFGGIVVVHIQFLFIFSFLIMSSEIPTTHVINITVLKGGQSFIQEIRLSG